MIENLKKEESNAIHTHKDILSVINTFIREL